MIKAIGLFSGGLDSILAVKLIKDQGIQVEVIHYGIGVEPLHIERRVKQREIEVTEQEIEQQLGVSITHLDVAQEFLSVFLHPKHGYGSGMNPCIDCKIFIMQKARAYMEAHDAQFVFTGEVIGQRPMSQHRQTLLQTEREAGLSGYLVRPLSAKLLDPTIPEQQGWVDREKFLDISGRGRKAQTELAQKYQLRYPQPAGGCLLTDPQFSKRLKELLTYIAPEHIQVEDVQLLKLGRHFRFPGGLKVIVGRHEFDNTLLAQYVRGRWQAQLRECEGPLVLIEGNPANEQFEQIAQLLVSYTKAKHAEQATVDFIREDERHTAVIIPDITCHFEPWRVI
ncbi:tRNA methyl transferase-like protein [Candidatus Vecturithrix granuli]|uniref:tRNA methyl transferase-like protein n=1 Tax=Vecturithrix granuli TaxID=1499967 RepID=A0A0S6W982_VECG1|nr:tRNA methyl transferase-like protein [Candidatus Vecturithrix granuli]